MGFNGIGALPALQVDTGYLSSPTPINAFRQGMQDRQVQDQTNLLKQVGQVASTGNYLDAAKTAMAGGDIKTGMDISNWDTGRRTKAIDFLTEGAQRADTPEKWNALVDVAENAFGSDLVGKYRDFNSRPAALTALQSAQLKIQQANADREAQESAARIPYLNAQTKSLGQKDALNEAIAGMVTNATKPDATGATPAPDQTAPTVQPQSFNGAPTMPGVTLASNTQSVPGPVPAPSSTLAAPSPTLPRFAPTDLAARAPIASPVSSAGPQGGNLIFAGDTPAPAAKAAPAQPVLIDTPLGKMTAAKAKQLGLALALSGKGDAGKLLTDAANQGELSKGATTQNDKEELAATGQLATLDAVKDAFDTKFLNIPNRFKFWSSALAEKFTTLSPKDQADLAAYTQFRQATFHNVNRVLKDLSGTAVTENEMQRQLKDQPNAGNGIGDGDSPTEFATKLRGELAFAHSAIARARYLRAHGFTGKPWDSGISIDDMPAIINQRAKEVEQQIKESNPNVDPMKLQGAVTRQIKQEFGI